ncbi:MAG: methyl-accepting chemotaxis protein [Amphritea sp.]
MVRYQLGFKNKLHFVTTLALIGFTVLSAICFNALQVLGEASKRVDSINQNVNLLKDLQLNVLVVSAQPDIDTLQQLLPRYGGKLNQLALRLPAEQAATINGIHSSLQDWVSNHLLWINERHRIGLDIDQGHRSELDAKMTAMEVKLFSNIRKPFNELKQNVDAFIEHRGQDQYQQANAALKALKQLAIDLDYIDFIGPKINDVEAAFNVLADSIFTMNTQGKNAAQAYQLLAIGVDSSNVYLQQQLVVAKSEAEVASEQAQILILGVCIAVALLVVGLLIRISHDVVSKLENMSRVLHKIAGGDLTQRLYVNETRGDELDQVGMAVNEMTASLSQVLTRVTLSSQTLDKGAADLSFNLSAMVTNNSETDEQAVSVAAAAEQISSTIQDMASATDAAHHQAQQAQLSADQGGEVITSAIHSLGKLATVFDDLDRQLCELKTASGKVDGVTEMINGLAEQTNLLALNAAIEAARAGDAGRGFSVVADEVRSLAGKTVQATQDITDIIGAMHCGIESLLKAMMEGSHHVNSGRELGDKAATAVEQIKLLVLDVTGRNQELVVNIEYVSKSTQMIAESMDQVAGNVSQNKNQSQEIQQYVYEVSGRTTELLAMTERFRCRSEDSGNPLVS